MRTCDGSTDTCTNDGANVDALINTNGDVYVFLLGDSLDTWWSARREFVRLTGPTPVLPEWAFGIWFTWWHAFTEAEAKAEILRWRTDKLPLDVSSRRLVVVLT